MKTTFDVPEELLVRAKKRAAELRLPLRFLVTEGLRGQLAATQPAGPRASTRRRRIRWITAAGGIPPGLDLSNREHMHDWLRRRR